VSTALYRPFDVVALAVGEAASARVRPALVVSTPEFERSTGMVWIAMITSTEHERQYGDVPIGDQAAAGLPSPSVIRAAKLATIEVGRIRRRLGSLSESDRAGARVALRASAGFV